MLFVADSAKERIEEIIRTKDLDNGYFVGVTVTSGGCSGLSYQMDFDNENKPNDQIFDDNGVKVVTDLKSFLYLCNILHTSYLVCFLFYEKFFPRLRIR